MKRDAFFDTPDYITLFQTEAWRSAWEQAWGRTISQDSAHELNFYQATLKLRNLVPVKTLYPIGCQSPRIRSIRSEYYRPKKSDIAEYLDCVIERTSGQCIFPDVVIDGSFYQSLKTYSSSKNIDLHLKNVTTAFSVNTAESNFADYIAGLKGSARRKVFNQREKLQSQGEVTFNQSTRLDEFIEILNNFHQQRWGKPCYQGNSRQFIERLTSELPREGGKVEMNEMLINGRVESVLLDITVGRRVYNLQAGFNEGFQSGVSLGMLHLGYRIEAAFNDSQIDAYDMMAGIGKQTNYKVKLANQYCELCDIVLVKSFFLAGIYKIHELLRRL